LLNKVDLVPEPVALEREEFLRREFDAPLVLATTHAAADHTLIFGSGRTRSPRDLEETRSLALSRHDHGALVETLSVDVAGPVDPTRISAFLRQLPSTAFRVKGILDIDGQPTILNVVGGRGRLGTVVPDSDCTGTLVFVGRDLKRESDAIRAAVGEYLSPG